MLFRNQIYFVTMAKYRKDLIREMEDWVKENGLMDYGGAKLKDFCAHFGISQETYFQWMKKDEFSELIKKAKEDFKKTLETDIVKSLANAAKGYEYTQTTTEFKDINGRRRPVKQTIKNIRVEANVGAGIFILTNIAPDRWKNKQRNELEVSDSDWVGALKQLTDGYDEESNNEQRDNS